MHTSRKLSLSLAALFAFVLSISTDALAQSPPRTIPTFERTDTVRIGPANSLDRATGVQGRVSFIAVPADEAREKISLVEFLIDGAPLGTVAKKPFRIDYDVAALREGKHTVKALGRDSSGKEIWNASASIDVSKAARENESRQRGFRGGPVVRTPRNEARADAGDRPRTPQPRRSGRSISDSSNRNRTGSEAAEASRLPKLPEGIVLDQEYASSYYGFSIKYPRGWTFEDQTAAMKPKSSQEFWIQFGTYPIEKSNVVINIRRIKLSPDVDAEVFARQNTYVKSWERRTVLGRPAFACTSRVLSPRPAVVHRLIIVGEGFAWMMNCTDYAGKSPEASRSLFENMIASLKISSADKPSIKG